ncbi:MAG: flagellar export chaperone FliS [Sedimentisphaerales bacterium]|nr:flagellar export chaperone FliS [Sedimentisphaerales bacterium]
MDKRPPKSNQYLQTKVLTASPEQLQLMLYDGAIRFCEQARAAIEAKKIEESFTLLTKAEKIMLELIHGLRDEVAPEICTNMRRLYLFCYERLVQANVKKTIPMVDEALRVLREIRETWVQVMEKIASERAAELPAPPTRESAAEDTEQLTGAMLSVEG